MSAFRHPEEPEYPAPMSRDQLDWITEQNERAARKATWRTLRTALAGYVILFVGIFAVYHNGQSLSTNEQQAIVRSGSVVAVDGCNRDYRSQMRFVNLLERLQNATEEAHKSLPKPLRTAQTEQRYAAAKEFYGGEIKRAISALPDCRLAAQVLTNDPDAERPQLSPLYHKKG